jgi:SNF2 family DNA or RNA helicase
MIIHEPTNQVVLKVSNPKLICEAIPGSQIKHVGGQDIVLTPFTLEATRALNSLNIKAPSPITTNYKWAGTLTPKAHQIATSSFATLNERHLILNEIGTGKTMSALWMADYLLSIGDVNKVLIVSPLSTLERVWGDSIFINFIHRKFVVLHGTRQQRIKKLRQEADFYIINFDGFKIIQHLIKNMFDLMIIDEVSELRNPSTDRFKVFYQWVQDNNPKLCMMTGTPTPESPENAWSLARLVGYPYLPSYTRFRDMTTFKVQDHVRIPRPESVEIVRQVLQPSIRFTREECLDLPPTTVQTRLAALTTEQRDYYKKMQKKLIVELKGLSDAIVAANKAVLLMKLVQICCGVVYTENGSVHEIDAKPRVTLVKEIIDEAGGKVILFVPLTGVLQMLRRELSKRYTVEIVYGDVPTKERNKIFHDFQNTPEPRILLAHPQTMSHGLTLTSATTIIWYGPIYSNDVYTQANGRIERIGKNKSCTVVHILSTELEEVIYNKLSNKQKIQQSLLELIRGDSHENW